MQKTFDLKTYDIPDELPKAQELCHELVKDLEKTHDYYRQQIAFLKQQYKIALSAMRACSVTSSTLRELFDEPEMVADPKAQIEIEDEEKPSDKRKRKKKQSAIPEHLPRQVIEHDVDATDKICAEDRTTLRLMGFDTKLELKYTPAKFEVLEHRYLKYSCDVCKGAPVRKPTEATLIPQSYASPELLAHIAMAKFCDHLPLYRQEQIYAREGVHLTRQVMAGWMIKLGEGLKPLIGLMQGEILDSPVVNADETPVKILTKDGVRTSHQAYMWQISRWGPRPLVIFEFDMSRKKEVAQRLLGTYEGFVQIDGYGGYDSLFTQPSPRIRVGCMAHVVRKFKDFVKSLPKDQRRAHSAMNAIRIIDRLYAIEHSCRGFSAEERASHRLQNGAALLLEQLSKFVAEEKETISSSSPYFAALRYANDELPHIAHYLDHGAIELDNNLAENAIRPFALGRRNWLFICTELGAQASANIYSLLITAKVNGIEPHAYLTRVIKLLPHCKTIADYENLLPA